MVINEVFYRNPHNYDVKQASDDAAEVPVGPSMTVQAQAEDVDINVIMKRFGVTGRMPEGIEPLGYGDFSEIRDFRSAHHAVMEARERFEAMPWDVRARFMNDPQKFLEFCSNRDNLAELRAMGLAVKEVIDGQSLGAAGQAARVDGASSAGGVGNQSVAVGSGNTADAGAKPG